MMVDRLSGESVLVRCGSRRLADCVSCSALYSGDASAILRAGVLDVDPSSTVVMLTLTAPSFGAVHRVPRNASPRLTTSARNAWEQRAGRALCRCGVKHEPGDRLAGVAIDPDSYDYDAQAEWNAAFGRLWNRTATRLTRDLGLAERLPYAGTTEWQARGAVHAHMLVRLPAWVQLGLFKDSVGRLRSSQIEDSVQSAGTTVAGRCFRWGSAVVAEIISAPGMDAGRHAKRTIGYLRKALAYTVKDLNVEPDGGRSHRHFARCRVAGRNVRCPSCAGGLRSISCRSPRHRSFGYAGHAVRKSRSWCELTFRALREKRAAWHAEGGETPGPRDWVLVKRTVNYQVQSIVDRLTESRGRSILDTCQAKLV